MFKFARRRKRLLQFILGFWVVIFIHLIPENIVKGQNNLDSNELIHSDYQEWYEIVSTLREWLNNLADKNPIFAWFIIFVLGVIIIPIVCQRLKAIWEDITAIFSDQTTPRKNILYRRLILIIIVSVVFIFYLLFTNP